MKTQLTIFSTPKPFSDPHISLIQENAIRSWVELGNRVEVVLIGDDEGVARVAKKINVKHIPKIARNKEGTPLIDSIFTAARNVNDSPMLAFINTDVMVLQNFLEIPMMIKDQNDAFLLVGQRWDLEVTKAITFSKGWQIEIKQDIKQKGRLHPPAGSDYFIFPRTIFQDIPSFALGRAGWDNWMIFKARWEHWKVIDCSGSITVVHQDHDYRHLPGGKPHYRLPESYENIRIAGGKRTIYHLEDADAIFENNRAVAPKLTWQKWKREMETFPLNSLHSFCLANLSFALWHPRKAYQEVRAALRKNRKTR